MLRCEAWEWCSLRFPEEEVGCRVGVLHLPGLRTEVKSTLLGHYAELWIRYLFWINLIYPGPGLTNSAEKHELHKRNNMSSFQTFVVPACLVSEYVVALFRDCGRCGWRRNVLVGAQRWHTWLLWMHFVASDLLSDLPGGGGVTHEIWKLRCNLTWPGFT